ncbi:MAG: hypothetical protein Q9177_006949, partial [Variospora cf. flavescens]
YFTGLKDKLREQLTIQGRPNSLEGLINRAHELDERLFEIQLDQGRRPFQQPRQNQRFNQNYQQRKVNYGPEPMDLSATRQGLTRQEKEHRMQNRLCLYCGKPGHQARNCNLNGNGKRAQTLKATQSLLNDDYEEDTNLP